ncbi:MAG TPA: DUF5666 domain-containing protein [Dehalococcoidia bacterium]|nr:DUF5666 domain-containing protein [Dehalococcoidia bacterium]
MRSFGSILDECLEAIGRGEVLESCLARYPRQADELRAQIRLAQRIAATPHHPPRPVAQAAGWHQFQAQAQDMRLGRKRHVSLNIGWLRPLTIAVALVIAVIGAAGGSVYASQDALPDSPLYRVKLTSEDVRVWFTFDDSRKAELLLDQSNERTGEIMEMLSRGKALPGNVLSAMRDRNARAVRILEDHPDQLDLVTRAREQSAEQEDLLLVLWSDVDESAQGDYAEAVATLHNAQLRTAGIPGSVKPDDVAAGVMNISGSAQPAAEGVWLLGGVEVRLDMRTLGGAALQSGQPVHVIAARGANGRLLALSVTTTDGEQPEQKYVVSGTVDEIGDNEVVIAGQRIALTDKTLLKLKLERGKNVEIRVNDVGGEAVAASVERGSGESEEAAATLLAFEGAIENDVSTQNATSDWVVGGQEFTVTPDTEIDVRDGTIKKGALARVEAVADDGEAIAKRIIVLAEADDESAVHLEGVLEKSDDESWTVGGLEVAVPAEAEPPEVGSLVTLDGHREDRRVVAEKLLTTPHPGRRGFALIRGPLYQIGDSGVWQVGLATVEVPAEATIRGEPAVGGRAFIWASRDDEGTLRAVFINVLRTH